VSLTFPSSNSGHGHSRREPDGAAPLQFGNEREYSRLRTPAAQRKSSSTVAVNQHPLGLCDPGSCDELCGLPGADNALIRRNPPLDPQPVRLEDSEFTSVAEELLDRAKRRSTPLIWFDTFDEEHDEWRDMNAEIRKLSSLSTLNSVPYSAKLSSRSVPRSPSHHVQHRSYSPCNRSATVALPSLPHKSAPRGNPLLRLPHYPLVHRRGLPLLLDHLLILWGAATVASVLESSSDVAMLLIELEWQRHGLSRSWVKGLLFSWGERRARLSLPPHAINLVLQPSFRNRTAAAVIPPFSTLEAPSPPTLAVDSFPLSQHLRFPPHRLLESTRCSSGLVAARHPSPWDSLA
jgi:hypothetical protein